MPTTPTARPRPQPKGSPMTAEKLQDLTDKEQRSVRQKYCKHSKVPATAFEKFATSWPDGCRFVYGIDKIFPDKRDEKK